MQHRGPIAGIAAHGGYVATAGYDNQLILWDGRSRNALARANHDHLVNACAFSADGRLLVSASSDYSARIFEVPSLRLKAALLGHEDDVDMAEFSPDGSAVATCALDRCLRIFDLSGNLLKTFRGHEGNVLSLLWSLDGKRLVSSSVDGTVREWDVDTGAELRRNDLDQRTDTVAMDALGRIYAGDDHGRIAVIVEGRPTYFKAHQAGIKKIAYDPARQVLVSLSYDRTLAVWQVEPNAALREISRSPLPAVIWARAAALLDDGRVAIGSFGSSYAIFDWRSGEWDVEGIDAGPGINAVAVLAGGVYSVGDAGTVFVDGEPCASMGSLCNFLLPLGGRVLTGGQLGQVFDARSGEVLYEHRSPLNCAASFLREGRAHAVIGTYTGEALVFALENDGGLRLVSSLKIYENAIKGLAADGETIFSVCASTDIAWHRIDDFSLVRYRRKVHERIANACCIAGPGLFASVSRDRALRIWDGEREEIYPSLHPNSVKCIGVSDDGAVLMTGSYGGTLAGFDLKSRSWLPMTRPTASGISALAYDGRRDCFLAASYDGSIYETDRKGALL